MQCVHLENSFWFSLSIVIVAFSASDLNLQEYIAEAAKTEHCVEKNWDFIKLHLLNHLFDDIESKGETCNYNTKQNEKMHGPVKKAYRDCMNFKNIVSQVTKEVYFECHIGQD